MDNNVNITYETLFDILRNEKNREELQKLEPSFFEDLIQYMKEKKELLSQDDGSELFSDIEKEKTAKQIENIKKLVRQLYERREKKIINLAMISSRTSSLLDDSALLKQEKELFNLLLSVLNQARVGILLNILRTKNPEIKLEQPEKEIEKKAEPKPKRSGTIMIRFIHAVPKFLGSELEIYGPFEEEDITNLPVEIAELLISKERAEEIKQ